MIQMNWPLRAGHVVLWETADALVLCSSPLRLAPRANTVLPAPQLLLCGKLRRARRRKRRTCRMIVLRWLFPHGAIDAAGFSTLRASNAAAAPPISERTTGNRPCGSCPQNNDPLSCQPSQKRGPPLHSACTRSSVIAAQHTSTPPLSAATSRLHLTPLHHYRLTRAPHARHLCVDYVLVCVAGHRLRVSLGSRHDYPPLQP